MSSMIFLVLKEQSKETVLARLERAESGIQSISGSTQRYRRPSTAACLACIEIVYNEEKIFCTEPTRATKAEQKSLVPARKPNTPTKEGPLCTL